MQQPAAVTDVFAIGRAIGTGKRENYAETTPPSMQGALAVTTIFLSSALDH
jgi:hypothetical protein